MSKKIIGSLAGCYSPLGRTFILTDANSNELTGVVVDTEKIIDATINDVREGKTFVSNEGVKIGEKNIPAYRTEKGYCAIFAGDTFSIQNMGAFNKYDYTELQCMIAPFNENVKSSVAVDKVVLYDNVYSTGSLTSLSAVTKNSENMSIDLNIINDSDENYIIHYFTYREEV